MTPLTQKKINQEFLKAVKNHDVNHAIELIGRGADMEAGDGNGRTALVWSAGHGYVDVVAALLEKGADPEAKDDEGRTALMLSVYRSHVDMAMALIDKGVDLEAKDDGGMNALMYAAWAGLSGVALELIEKGADLEAKDNPGSTALTWARFGGHANVALTLIAHGADSKKLDQDYDFHGFMPLQACAAGGLLPKFQALLDDPLPNELASDSPQALIELALKYKQSGAAGILQSHLASKAIDGLLAQAAPVYGTSKRGRAVP